MNPEIYKNLITESANPHTRNLDELSVLDILRVMNREDQKIPQAVRSQIKKIAAAGAQIVSSLKSGGRIFFVGAGTSGRLGVLEAAELPPTFNTPPNLARAIMAGGKKSVFRSLEGAEDNAELAAAEIRKSVRAADVVVGIAASGVTPFVRSALMESKKIGAKTILITCNAQRPVLKFAQVVIAPAVGPEVIAGSTRLKSATATKMVLNMLTVSAMAQLGKVYGNRMVDLQPKSKKLVERGVRLLQEICGISRGEAQKYFRQARGHVKTAIVMEKKKLSYSMAQNLLARASGSLRKVIG